MTWAQAWSKARVRTDARLRELLDAEPAEVREVLAAALEGGKRLRPALLLLVHDAHQGRGVERAERWAAGLELIHAATLIHDDLLDGDLERRGRPAVHARYGARLAVLAGDAAVAWGVGLVEEPEAAQRVRVALREAWRGAWREATEGGSEQAALGKTASLFRLACELGAVAAGAATVAEAGDFGERLGLAYQAADDAVDGAGAAAAKRAEVHALGARAMAARFPPGLAGDALREAPDAILRQVLATPPGAAP